MMGNLAFPVGILLVGYLDQTPAGAGLGRVAQPITDLLVLAHLVDVVALFVLMEGKRLATLVIGGVFLALSALAYLVTYFKVTGDYW
jgi:hypothetical protein